MATVRQEEKVFVIKKESVRGTAEANATSGRSLPVLPASAVNFVPALLADAKVYGDPMERPAQGGIREGSGTLELEPGADKLGELLLSLFGQVTTDQPDVGGAPLVFRHRFTPATSALHPLYTLFVEQGFHQKKYNGLSARQLTFNIPVDGRVACSADVIFKLEASGENLTPDFSTDLGNLLFSDATIQLASPFATSAIVRQASVVLNNNSVGKRTLSQSKDVADIIAGPFRVTGTFQMYFEDETERVKFIASSASGFRALIQGEGIQTQLATLDIECPNIKYSAGPVSEVDGVLVQDFAFMAHRDPTAGYSARATLINKVTAY